jgi:hypothetical protein
MQQPSRIDFTDLILRPYHARVARWKAEIERKQKIHLSTASDQIFLHEAEQALQAMLDKLADEYDDG